MIRSFVTAALAGAVALVGPFAATAHAQSCSGGNDSSSSSGSSGSSDGGGTDSTTEVEVCRDVTEVTGLTECTRFGDGWDASGWPTLDLGVGLEIGHLPLERTFGGGVQHDGNPYRWDLGEHDLNGGTTVSFRLRATGFFTSFLYAGVELGFGGGSVSGPRLRIGELEVSPQSLLVGDAGVVGGLSVPVGPVVLRAEVLTGLRAVGLSVETTRGACVAQDTDWHAELAVAPRVGIDWYLTPWLSVGAYGGTHVLGSGDWHGGLDLRVHTRSFNGQRSP